MADGGTGCSNFHQFWPREGGSGENQRGEGGGSVSWLTSSRDSPWWPDLAREGGGGDCSSAPLRGGGPATGRQ